jgi:pyrrolidone-carboxylate peptidase
LLDFSEVWILSTNFKKIQISNLMKIRRVAAELFHADGHAEGRTDMTKPTVAFNGFQDVLKINKDTTTKL